MFKIYGNIQALQPKIVRKAPKLTQPYIPIPFKLGCCFCNGCTLKNGGMDERTVRELEGGSRKIMIFLGKEECRKCEKILTFSQF
jgi:hypothetical protein